MNPFRITLSFLWLIYFRCKTSFFRIPFMRKKPGISNVTSSSVRVITDIDDTVKSSGGIKFLGIALGGIDTQYQRGHYYPGAIQFAFELSKYKSQFPSKLAVLTARAREFKFALAVKPNGKLGSAYRVIGEKHGHKDWGIEDVFYGSVKEWIFQDRKGIRKFRNFEKLIERDNFRNQKYIFIGDTGEMDEDAGERMIEKHANKIKAVFLHYVSDESDRSLARTPNDRMLNSVPIFYFKTYVGAAHKAYQHNFIGADGLSRIISQAKSDLHQLEPYPLNDMKDSSRWIELEHDIQIAKNSI